MWPGSSPPWRRQTYTGPWEVVVVDNGSTDASVQVVEAWRERIPGLRIVDASGARGLNHARNRGADAARGDLLAFADADDEAVPGWLESLATAAAFADLVGGALDGDALNDGMIARSIPRGGAPRASLGVRLPSFCARRELCRVGIPRPQTAVERGIRRRAAPMSSSPGEPTSPGRASGSRPVR